MLSVFVCEDDKTQRERLERYIKNYIMIEDYDMQLVLSVDNPEDILEYLEKHPGITGLYFLDIDLKHEMTGIRLATEIREVDDLGKIVFVTTHGELSYLTFIHKVEAMDYIIKGVPEEVMVRVQECIRVAHKRHLNDQSNEKKVFKVKLGSKIRAISYSEIMFFESSTVPHKIILHMRDGQLEFYQSIRELENIAENFYRCHKSFVVNKEKIKNIDKKKREIEMENGEICLVSVRGIRGIL